MQRTIEELLDAKTGKLLSAADIFTQPEEQVYKLRGQLREAVVRDEKMIVCLLCQQPVLIAVFKEGGYYFKHHQELGDCPIKTKGKYSADEINRMKYNGAKESDAHRDLKTFIHQALLSDERFPDVHCEKVVKGTGGLSREWKKPDVSSVFGDKPLVWEIQLSTTFHHVIVERECFYQDNKTYIMWVFNEFDTERLRCTEKDIFWQNKANAFVIDERTMALTEERGELVLGCCYLAPTLVDGKVLENWVSQDVTIDDLKFDPETYKVYYHDLDEARRQIAQEQDTLALQEFEEYWLTRAQRDSETVRRIDSRFCRLFSRLGVAQIERMEMPLAGTLNAVYSAKNDRVIGYDLDNLNAVANTILENYKPFTKVLARALYYYGRVDGLIAADKKGRFRGKIDRYKQAVKVGDPQYKQNREYDQLFRALFPELAEHI